MYAALCEQALDPWAELQAYQARAFAKPGTFGASAVFVGTMRDYNQGDSVSRMFLEHYPGMTESFLEKLGGEAMTRWDIDDCLLLHRVGEVQPGDAIVLVAVWSAHRAAALAACRGVMEELKLRAPFWKRETTPQGCRWVSGNTPG